MKNIISICIVSGLISILIVLALFWFVFTSAWLFFIIPLIMGWTIDKFGKFDASQLKDEVTYERISRRTGLLCGSMVLLCIFICILPLFFLFPIIDLLVNFAFYIVCGISIYWGYNRGVQCVTDAYYSSYSDEN